MNKLLLLCLLCIIAITSCNNDIIEPIPENASEDLSLRAASAVHPLDRSFTVPLWEYESVNPTPKGYKDYYYMPSDNPASSITVNNTAYVRVRQLARIFRNNIGSPYIYNPNTSGNLAFPLTIWYSPSMKRHRVVLFGSPASSYPDYANDYYQTNILGYMPNYIAVNDRPIYQQPGMLDAQTSIRHDPNTNAIRLGTPQFFIDNYPSPPGSLSLTEWIGMGLLGFMYQN